MPWLSSGISSNRENPRVVCAWHGLYHLLAAKKPCSSFGFGLPAPSAQVMFFAPPDGVIDQEEATLARIRDTPDDTAEQYAFCRDPELWVDSEHFASIWRNVEVRCDRALQRLVVL